jgi:glutamate formiminotransferase
LTPPTLLAVPNVSEGRDHRTIDALGQSLEEVPDARLLDVHSDPDHHRSVFTIAGGQNGLVEAVMQLAHATLDRIDLHRHEGAHPRVGALDVAPIVYLRQEDIGAASGGALVLGDRLSEELELPVFLYGALAGGRTRADLRRGGLDALAERMHARELVPDFGPAHLRPGAGATLVSARPPLVAFNLELAPGATLEEARAIAGAIREGGADGLPGVRAMGVWLEHRGMAQVSTNVEDPLAVPLVRVVEAVARRGVPVRAELVGLALRRALEEFPPDLPLDGAATIEDALEAGGSRQGSRD